MILETVQTEGIAELSYLIGDDKTGTAAVIDPRADVEIYIELARRRKVAITPEAPGRDASARLRGVAGASSTAPRPPAAAR